ncbi:MAG: lysophospholipid acyltransferase family protein [Phycisphaerales bacterium JB040]
MEWFLWTILSLVGSVAAAFVVGSVWAALTLSRTLRLSDRVLFFWGRVYTRVVHRVRVEGRDNIPDRGPFLFVANHTAGVDPILITAPCTRPVRWIMALDMKIPILNWFWAWQRTIFVGRDGKPGGKDRGASGLRAAMEELKAGGAIGIFPEGGIERPPERVMPYQAGVGLMIRKAGVPVVPVWVSGTPQVDPAWASLWKFSRSRVVYGEPMDFTDRRLSATEIADELRAWAMKTSGWPPNDNPRESLTDVPEQVAPERPSTA